MYKIVLIDDEPWVLARLRTITDWENAGYKIIGELSGGEKIWDELRRLKPDAVFTDINMPGMSGLELLSKARENGIDTEFIIISGYDDFEYARKAIAGGVFYYFLKPVQESEFVSVISRLKAKLDEKNGAAPRMETISIPETQSPVLNDILLFISEHYASSLGLEDISRKFFISQTYVCDLFSKYLNTTFVKYLTALRLSHAAQELEKTEKPVAEIALSSGFKDYSYFSKTFKAEYGLTPTQYRNK